LNKTKGQTRYLKVKNVTLFGTEGVYYIEPLISLQAPRYQQQTWCQCHISKTNTLRACTTLTVNMTIGVGHLIKWALLPPPSQLVSLKESCWQVTRHNINRKTKPIAPIIPPTFCNYGCVWLVDGVASYILAEGMQAEWNRILEKVFGGVAWAEAKKTKMLFGCLHERMQPV